MYVCVSVCAYNLPYLKVIYRNRNVNYIIFSIIAS